jgi:hypothetical protein
METHIHTEETFTFANALGAIGVALVFITIMSLVKEPYRQKINALIIAGAGATYWSGGLGYYEFPLGAIMLFLAYKGLTNYNYIAIGWLVHTVYDILHHLYGNPIVPMAPLSSAGCAVCDPVLAIWFFLGAPTIFNLFKRNKKAIA